MECDRYDLLNNKNITNEMSNIKNNTNMINHKAMLYDLTDSNVKPILKTKSLNIMDNIVQRQQN